MKGIVDFAAMDDVTAAAAMDTILGTQKMLQDLANSAGWKFFQQSVASDLAGVRSVMDTTTDPVPMARAVGAQKQLMYAQNFIEIEMKRCVNALKQFEMQRKK